MSTDQHPRSRWLAMGILCMGALMIVLDITIVNVALPSIRADLKFDDASLAWVVNAYMLIFGGFPAPGRAPRGPLRAPARVPGRSSALFTAGVTRLRPGGFPGRS